MTPKIKLYQRRPAKQKKAQDDKMPSWLIQRGKNESWLSSVGLALNTAIFYAPTTLFLSLLPPCQVLLRGLGMSIKAVFLFCFAVLLWVWTTIAILVCGFAGNVKRLTKEEYRELSSFVSGKGRLRE